MAQHMPLMDIKFIRDFAAFCRTKGSEKYNYFAHGNCAVAQFLRESGRATDPSVGGITWGERASRERHDLPVAMVECRGGVGVVAMEPYTFAALADRLEALLVDAPVVARVSGADEQVSG